MAEENFPFWSSPSLEELAEQQKVSPVEDLDEISALWPVDDDPDKLLDYILAERSARRRISGESLAKGCENRSEMTQMAHPIFNLEKPEPKGMNHTS